MSKRYLSLKKRPTVAQRPYCMGSSSCNSYASKNIEKLNEETKKLEEWKNLK